jgi:hypothetical protein
VRQILLIRVLGKKDCILNVETILLLKSLRL